MVNSLPEFELLFGNLWQLEVFAQHLIRGTALVATNPQTLIRSQAVVISMRTDADGRVGVRFRPIGPPIRD